MIKLIIIGLVVVLLTSCGDTVKNNETKIVNTQPPKDSLDIETVSVVVKDTIIVKNEPQKKGIIFTEATVLSVQEELIMPSDYLTTAMTVITDDMDTLVFLNINEEDVKIGQRISLYYEIMQEYKMLVCFDCESYSDKVKFHDITALAGDVTFESLKFVKYNEDEYIIPASTFSMLNENGKVEEFHSNIIDLVNDSTEMSEGFHSYGIVTKLYPKLEKYE